MLGLAFPWSGHEAHVLFWSIWVALLPAAPARAGRGRQQGLDRLVLLYTQEMQTESWAPGFTWATVPGECVSGQELLPLSKKKNHKNVEKLQSCYVISGNVMVHAIWKIVWQFVINLLYDSASPNLQIYPKESKTYLLKDSYNMFNAASLIKSYNVETL